MASLPTFRGPIPIEARGLCDVTDTFISFEILQTAVNTRYRTDPCPNGLHHWLSARIRTMASGEQNLTAYLTVYEALKPCHFTWYRCPGCKKRI